MPAYCIFLPRKELRAREFAEAPTFVADGFSWPAFYFGPIWCVWRRSWLGFFLWTLSAAALTTAIFAFRIPVPGVLTMISLVSFAIAMEASVLVRRSLERRGMYLVDYVVAPNREQAEHRFFERLIQVKTRLASVQVSNPLATSGDDRSHEMGLFADSRGTM